MLCRKCNKEVEPKIIQRPETIHSGGEQKCPICNFHLGWKKKEKNTEKRNISIYSVSYFGIDYCQLCLRTKDKLGLNETLIRHHIIEINPEYEGEPKGEDKPNNIWIVCTHCHQSIHHIRRYLNYHQKYKKE